MDIAAFISDLLARNGVLVVPGFGTFTKKRVDGYYSRDIQQFYPPTQQIQFKTEYTDDGELAKQIAAERQISVASANYFIEKFVSAIVEQAGTGTAAFGTMGNFSTRRGALVFTPSDLNETDELFYGLAPVRLKRNSAFKQNVPAPPKLVEMPVIEPEPIPEPVEVDDRVEVGAPDEEDYAEVAEEEIRTRRFNIWLVLALLIILIGVSIIAVYKYKPALFDRFKPLMAKFVSKPAPVKKLSAADSAKQAAQGKKDVGLTLVTAKGQHVAVQPEPAVTASTDTFRIISDSFKTLSKAKAVANDYIEKDINAGVTGPTANHKFEVYVGQYMNKDSADHALPILKEKLKRQDINIHIYPLKK